MKKTDVGCFFARKIAFRPEDVGTVIEIVSASSTPTRIAASIDQRITRLIASPDAAAAALIFPAITTLTQLASGMIALRHRPGWKISFADLAHAELGDMVTVGMSREIPFGDGTVPSEALVLGPFPEFPLTRRAPVAALEIFVGVPLKSDPKSGDPTKKANLAHLNVRMAPGPFKTMWGRSVAGRLKSLGDKDDGRAKAKVAFVVPKALALEIGAAS